MPRERKTRATMSAAQYRAAIERLGFTQVGIAPFLGISRRQAQRYALGERKIPEAVAKLLRLMLKLNLTPEDVP
jgi:hypothetical protein